MNGQAIATWDAMDKDGKLVSNGFYHLVLRQKFTDGTSARRERDVFISSNSQTSSAQLYASPNIANAGDTVRLSAAFGVNAADGRSTLKLYTVSGELVRTLTLSAGQASWDLTNTQGQTVSSGIYLIVLDGVDVNTGNPASKVIKVLVLK